MNIYIKLILIFILTSLVIFVSYFTFNHNIRRTVLTYVFVTHDHYQLKRLTTDLQNRNFSSASEKILKYINISKKFSSEKSYMIPGIYNAIELVASKALDQEDFNFLEKPLIELLKMEPNLYKPNVWLARALSDDSYEKSLTLLEKAISLSPSEDAAYREILRISQITKKDNLIDKYCNDFFISQLGGSQHESDFSTLFGSSNIKKFAVKFKSKIEDKNFYLNSGIQLAKFLSYEFIPNETLDLDGVDIYFSFLPGINLNLKEIIVHTNKDKKIIQNNELIITSNSSFIQNEKDNTSILSLKEGDEIIRITFKKKTPYKNIEKIELIINFKKMKLSNNFYCN